MLELVALLNRDFKINISDDELIPENLDSIASVCAFLRRKGIES
jgi:acyl carrier protein